MSNAQGFPGQRMVVIPRPLVESALQLPGTRELVVTDAGYFPLAKRHEIVRSQGIENVVVLVCVGGSGWAALDGFTHTIRAGQVLVLPPRLPHSYGASETDPWSLWWFHFTGSASEQLVELTGTSPQHPVISLRYSLRVPDLAEEIVSSMEADRSSANLQSASGAAWHLMTQLNRSRPEVDAINVLDEIRDHIHHHFAEQLSLEELATRAHLSRSHFSASFRRRFGTPPLRYQIQQRMARARELLDSSNMSVSRISQEVGYASVSYFTRHFRAFHDLTPREYRRLPKG